MATADYYSDVLTQYDPAAIQQAAQQESGGYAAPTPSSVPTDYLGNPDAIKALVKQWQAQNPYSGSIQPLYQWLQSQGVPVQLVDHRGQPSDDKLWIGGRMIDLIGDVGSPNAQWRYGDIYGGSGGAGVPAAGMPPVSGGGLTLDPKTFGSLMQPWTQTFSRAPWNQQFSAPTPDQIVNDPYYQFQLKEGQGAIERSAAAKGTLLNGGTLKDLETYGQGVASAFGDKLYNRSLGEYMLGRENFWTNQDRGLGDYLLSRENFYNNQDRPFSKLLPLAQMGQYSANQLGSYGSNYMNNMSDLYGAYGNAQSAGTATRANNTGRLVGSLGDLLGEYFARQQNPYGSYY